jgi:hypothetical protein
VALVALAACGDADDTLTDRQAFDQLMVRGGPPEMCASDGRVLFAFDDGTSRLLIHLEARLTTAVVHDLPTDLALLDRTGPPWAGGCTTPDAAFDLPSDPTGEAVAPVELGQLRWQPVDDGALETVTLAVELFGLAVSPGDPLRARAWSAVEARRSL